MDGPSLHPTLHPSVRPWAWKLVHLQIVSCSFKTELWSRRLLYQLQKVHCSQIKDVFTVLPRELSKHRRKTSKGKTEWESYSSRKPWDDRGLDSHLGWFWHVPSFLRVCSLHISRDQRVPTEHCLHAGIYYDHFQPLMFVFGPALLYCTWRDYRSKDESVQVIIDDIILQQHCWELYSLRSIRGLITL